MRVLMPIPSTDFDPTETAVPWRTLADAGIDVIFATPDGRPGVADERMISGRGLGPWKRLLRANSRARQVYAEMVASPEFTNPQRYDGLSAVDFGGLVLPGGHAAGMKPYLESKDVQRVTADFLAADKPLGAICHGGLVLARTVDSDGEPAIRGRRITALTKSMELSAWGLTGLWLGSYYRTYPETVQDEVERALGPDGAFFDGPFALMRDAPDHIDRGFTVVDGALVTARWPGDAHKFSRDFLELLLGL